MGQFYGLWGQVHSVRDQSISELAWSKLQLKRTSFLPFFKEDTPSDLWAKLWFLRDQVYIRIKALFTPGWANSYWRVQVWVFSLVWGTYYRFGGCLENKQAVIPLPGCESWYHPVTCAYISLISAKLSQIYWRSSGRVVEEEDRLGGLSSTLYSEILQTIQDCPLP